ncbi:DUF1330 domain-containing protein [Amphritea balenae]|nr:DUF1330 domain-containing protein [Amphritea balenae]GGK58811.1 hypothetical protein GCM10007941_06330 [Amphritea balenae]
MNNSKPAYLIASSILPEGHASLQAYAQAAQPVFQAHGAEVLMVGTSAQEIEKLEGSWPDTDARLSLIRFPSMQHLKDCFSSEAYKAIKHLRTDIIETNFTVAVD